MSRGCSASKFVQLTRLPTSTFAPREAPAAGGSRGGVCLRGGGHPWMRLQGGKGVSVCLRGSQGCTCRMGEGSVHFCVGGGPVRPGKRCENAMGACAMHRVGVNMRSAQGGREFAWCAVEKIR